MGLQKHIVFNTYTYTYILYMPIYILLTLKMKFIIFNSRATKATFKFQIVCPKQYSCSQVIQLLVVDKGEQLLLGLSMLYWTNLFSRYKGERERERERERVFPTQSLSTSNNVPSNGWARKLYCLRCWKENHLRGEFLAWAI